MIKTAVFVAAGMGLRLKEKTKYCPKGLIELEGVSMMRRSVEKLIDAGIEKIYIGTGYLSEQYDHFAKKYPQITTIKSEKYATTSSMYTLWNMRNFIKEDFLLLESDLLYDKKALDFVLKERRQDIILSTKNISLEDEFFIEVYENKTIRKASKNKNDLQNAFGIWVGVCKISMQAYKEMCEIFEGQKNEKLEYEYAMIACKKQPFLVKKVDLLWCEIDNDNQLKHALKKVLPYIK